MKNCCCLLVTALTVISMVVADDVLARPILFDISEGGTITCETPGSRCVFQEDEYDVVNDRNGQNTQNIEGNVWASQNPATDFLMVGMCQKPAMVSCYVHCNAGCSCETPNRTACLTAVSRAPTPSPPTRAPAPPVCPVTQNTEFCSQLMGRVPPNSFFDCYNYCGGAFISSCTFSGNCGVLDCNNATATGLESFVLGCTDEDRMQRLPSAEPSQAPSERPSLQPSSVVPSTPPSMTRSAEPSTQPSEQPSNVALPTLSPSTSPTSSPTIPSSAERVDGICVLIRLVSLAILLVDLKLISWIL